MEAPAEPLAPACRKRTEKGGNTWAGCQPGCLGPSWGLLVLCALECGKGLQLLPKPLAPHPAQSHAGSSSRALLTVHWCPMLDRKQAPISFPPEGLCITDAEASEDLAWG